LHESFTLLSIGDALHEPFASSELVFFPKDAHAEVKADPKGPWTAKVLPYANVWRYLQRLNTLAFGGWQLGEPQIITLSDRLIVLISVTVAGVTIWGVGEEMLAGTATRVDENAFRGAWAQATKRACAYFGLGLFLYFLGKPRSMAYDPKERRIAASDEDLSAMAEEMLSRARGMNQLVVPPACLVADLAGLHDRYLVEPFPVGQVHFLGFDARETESGSVATAAPFVRVWDLVRRLNATAYECWQVLAPRVTVADNKALVTLTLDLFGTSFVGTGEAFFIKTFKGEDVVNDHAVEDAWAEAMKGACNTADLGLYLRFLPQLQFPYRTKWRSFDDEPGIATVSLTSGIQNASTCCPTKRSPRFSAEAA